MGNSKGPIGDWWLGVVAILGMTLVALAGDDRWFVTLGMGAVIGAGVMWALDDRRR